MDRSLESIGSCSLDVDADSSETSDTSSSLNIVTPLSTKDITREFTSKVINRCPAQLKTIIVDPKQSNYELKTIITQPCGSVDELVAVELGNSYGKKPSYLNLACCVNGYSSITTYDSKIRQDINNSREVSPIRPSNASIHYCKKNSIIAPPVKITMPNVNVTNPSLCKAPMKTNVSDVKYFEPNNDNNQSSMGADSEKTDGNRKGNSFIQQRVERLYGPGALSQIFYSPKKVRGCFGYRLEKETTTEFSQKFTQLSPSKDYNEFSKKLNASVSSSALNSLKSSTTVSNTTDNNAIDLPVLRHLSQEFRAQLPSISPKRSVRTDYDKVSPQYFEQNVSKNTPKIGELLHSIQSSGNDEIDHKNPTNNKSDISASLENETHHNNVLIKTEITKLLDSSSEEQNHSLSNNGIGRDGNYFLSLLKTEQNRLLELAYKGEKYTDMLTNNPDISEEVFGILRSASGKARLLVSQKMKQFEGLCHNNLNRSPEDNFPTTVEDLQGFWDMVNLQVANIDAIFNDIELLKENGWKITIGEDPESRACKQQSQTNNVTPRFRPIKTTDNNNTKPSATALKREAQRKQLIELKRKQKMTLAASPLLKSELNNLSDLESVTENKS